MKPFTPLFQAVIAFTAVMTGLGFIFNLLLTPVKKDLARMESNVSRLEGNMSRLEGNVSRLDSRVGRLEEGLKLVQSDISEIKRMLSRQQRK